jgi:AGCS family alanine or glycine:cation symporter
MEELIAVLEKVDSYVWGPPLIVFLLFVGVFLTVRYRFLQVREFRHALDLIGGKYDDPKDEGEITHFQALSAALSATIGTGNIAGVATAIASGGPGAVCWMWIIGLLGMVNKYASASLGLHFRVLHPDGTASGGPMYYLEKGMKLKWLGWLFALFAAIASFGIGDMVQANSVAKPLETHVGIPSWATGVVVAILVGLVIIGGIRRIGKVASRIVPFMCVVYVGASLIILLLNLDKIPSAFALIFRHAFSPTSAAGGFLGATVAQTVRFGVARGLFSNEAGLGSASIAHSAAKTKEPVREGLVAMVGPFIDTIVICTMTALVIVSTGAWTSGLTSSPLSAHAFELGLPQIGKWIVTFGLVFFAFSTMITWSYYGDRCSEYILGRKAVMPYRWLFVILIPVGAVVKIDLVWLLTDIMNGFMAFPNLVGILGLSGLSVKMINDYFSRPQTPLRSRMSPPHSPPPASRL